MDDFDTRHRERVLKDVVKEPVDPWLDPAEFRGDPAAIALGKEFERAIEQRDALIEPYDKAKEKASRASSEQMRIYHEIQGHDDRARRMKVALAVLRKND